MTTWEELLSYTGLSLCAAIVIAWILQLAGLIR